ncbi:putative 60S ribosomal protein L28e [Golovinomyces cichoracearum]|uniref:Putative 60S ribosomal protein L28e n=1 Tax=Golovinomyces cichoracearum TaxID=62708 RepID=A0A420IIB7_9PEZI|nr:putative 60S ribosomal protein L28e [Golovinomyces cichoracearum]
MSHYSSQVSADLIWEVVRPQNSFLVKRASSGGVQLSRDPLNLKNIHSRKVEISIVNKSDFLANVSKYAGFVNDKAVGIVPGDAGAGGVTLITKKPKNAQRPASASYSTTFGSSKSTRKTYKGIVNTTVRSMYRSDLRAEAVARASAIRCSQMPKKDLPEKKLRGSKAGKIIAKKEE